MTPRQRLIIHLIGMGAVLCAGGICCDTAARGDAVRGRQPHLDTVTRALGGRA